MPPLLARSDNALRERCRWGPCDDAGGASIHAIFKVAEEEQAVTNDAAAEGHAKLIANQRSRATPARLLNQLFAVVAVLRLYS